MASATAPPGLVTNPDGSLDLYLQHQAPGNDEAANWLPTPGGPFRPMLRLYNPRPEAFNDQEWQLPAIRRRP
jgi:hypothetical protein